MHLNRQQRRGFRSLSKRQGLHGQFQIARAAVNLGLSAPMTPHEAERAEAIARHHLGGPWFHGGLSGFPEGFTLLPAGGRLARTHGAT